MNSTEVQAEFLLRFYEEEAMLIGARWWNEAFEQSASMPRRSVAFWAAAGVASLLTLRFACSGEDEDEAEATVLFDAIELQRREGWDVGQSNASLSLASVSPADVGGSQAWQANLTTLWEDLAPGRAEHTPYFVPSLFQALSHQRAASLQHTIRPIYRPSMAAAYDAAQAIGRLISEPDAPKDMAVILDLPGPDSVAAAAALAPYMDPVFTFDNWPHPRGVVPAHETLAAALYYRPRFLTFAKTRPDDAPPVFVLDAARLSPYRDDPGTFDNRYMAKLPTVSGWKVLGVRRLLYVRAAGTAPQELDDLNAEFVTYQNEGIEIKLSSISDFAQAANTPAGDTTMFWGGSPQNHVLFWPSYGWYQPSRRTATGVGRAARLPSAPASLAYKPAARATLFSGRTVGGIAGVGKQKPSGFGRVSVRTNFRTGAVTGFVSGRSGSFGRSRSSWGG